MNKKVAGILMLLCFFGCAFRNGDAAEYQLHSLYHPMPSYLTIEVFIGTYDDPFEVFLATVGTVGITGSAKADINVDEHGIGTFSILESNFVADEVTVTIDVQEFGTIDFALTGFGFEFTTQSKPVSANAFAFPFDHTSSNTLNQGSLTLFNPTGLLAELSPEYIVYFRDYGENPQHSVPGYNVVEPFVGLVDAGPSLDSPSPELQLVVTSFATPLTSLDDSTFVWFHIHGQLNVAAVPEPSSITMVASAALGLLLLSFGRYRRPPS